MIYLFINKNITSDLKKLIKFFLYSVFVLRTLENSSFQFLLAIQNAHSHLFSMDDSERECPSEDFTVIGAKVLYLEVLVQQ